MATLDYFTHASGKDRKRALLLYSKHHFDPACGIASTASAGVIAASLYHALIAAGFETDYIDPVEAAHFPQRSYDLFVGQPANWYTAARRSHAGFKILFMPTTHPCRRNRLMTSAAARWKIPFVEELLPCDWHSLAMFDTADLIIQIGNEFAVQALINEGVPRNKIRQFHYGIPHVRVSQNDQLRGERKFLHLASVLGLRKGLPETLALFEQCVRDDWKLSIMGQIAGTANKPYWEQRLAGFLSATPAACYLGGRFLTPRSCRLTSRARCDPRAKEVSPWSPHRANPRLRSRPQHTSAP